MAPAGNTSAERPVVGVILAGGASQRMGTDKALLEVGGRSMLAHIAATLHEVAERVVVAGRNELPDGVVATALPDRAGAERSGPLTGLLVAASAAQGALLVVVGCDQPLARAETLAGLVAAAGHRDGAGAEVDGVVQPLGAVYAADALLAAAAPAAAHVRELASRLDLAILEEEAWRALGDDGRTWESVDTPEDAARVSARLTDEELVAAWWERLAGATPDGVRPLDPALRADLLAIAKTAADASVRWAAPLTTFAVGLAVANASDQTGVRAAVARLRAHLDAGDT